MKKFIFSAIIAAVVLSLTACQKTIESDPGHTEGGGDELGITESDSGSAESEANEWSLSENEFRAMLEEYPDEISLPDGTTVSKNELTPPIEFEYGEAPEPRLDFAFIRYAEPIFMNTLDDPDLVDLNTFEINGYTRREIEPKWIKVKAGDILENGMKIASARSICRVDTDESGNTTAELGYSKIITEGDITYDGILEYYNGSEAYGYGDYSLRFFPDSSKYKLPVAYRNAPSSPPEIKVSALGIGNAIVYDGGEFCYFRFESRYSENTGKFKDMFTQDMVCKATVSFKYIVAENEGIMDGEITGIELET